LQAFTILSSVNSYSDYPLSYFVHPKLVEEAQKLAEASPLISINPPYRRDGRKDQGKYNPNGPRCPGGFSDLVWTPFGEVGTYHINEDTLLSVLQRTLPEVQEPDFEQFFGKYRYQEAISNMADWFLEKGLAVLETSIPPNTAVYVKIKPDASKLQVIGDASLRNKSMSIKPKNFVLFSCEHAKPVLRADGDTFMCSFDVSNFYHSFILPKLFHSLAPVVLRIPRRDGSSFNIRCLRTCFGDSLSPVLTHQAISDIFGIPSTVYVKGVDPKPHPCPWLNSATDVSGLFIDDILDLGKNRETVHDRYLNKRLSVAKHNMPVKAKSVFEDVLTLDYAGKCYSGKAASPYIANTRKNTIKLIALTIQFTTRKFVSADFISSLIGSFAFGTVHHKKALPFLSEINKLAMEGAKSIPVQDNIVHDVLIALQLSILPWMPGSEMFWSGCRPGTPMVIVDAAVSEGLVGMFLFNGVDECWVASFKVPIKFNTSQQSAELYGLFIALKRGEERFGSTFDVVSDSASSISSVTNLKMSSSPKARNNLVRKVVRWSFIRPLKVSMAWTDTKNNLADDPSRIPISPLNFFKPYPITDFKRYLSTSQTFFLSANEYAQR
jgi:hypothetical protein